MGIEKKVVALGWTMWDRWGESSFDLHAEASHATLISWLTLGFRTERDY